MAGGYIRPPRHTLPGRLLQGTHYPGTTKIIMVSVQRSDSFVLPQAELKFPMDYPYSPPRLRFLTPILHPNVYPVSSPFLSHFSSFLFFFLFFACLYCIENKKKWVYFPLYETRRMVSCAFQSSTPLAKTLTAENCRPSGGTRRKVSGTVPLAWSVIVVVTRISPFLSAT